MVAAKDDQFFGYSDLAGHFLNHFIKIFGKHSGIAAVLIDLIGRGFDQYRHLKLFCAFQYNFQRQRVSGTIGRNAAFFSLSALFHHFLNGVFHYFFSFRNLPVMNDQGSCASPMQ